MGSDLLLVLAWMAHQDFERIRGPLLEAVEHLVVAQHRALHGDRPGEAWSAPAAYRWIRYEDPQPVSRLLEAATRMAAQWGAAETLHEKFWREHSEELEAAVSLARALGYP